MAATAGAGSKIFVDKIDMSGEGRSVDISIDTDTIDSTTFDSTWKSSVTGMTEAKVDYKGVFEAASTGLDQWLTSNFTVVGKGMTVVPGPPVAGGVAYNGKVLATSRPVTIPIDNIIALAANFDMQEFGRGKIIEYENVAVGAQTGAGVDLGIAASGYSALSTDKWVTTMHLYGWTGSGTYTITLEESSDDGVADTYAAISSGVLAISGSTAGAYYNIDGPRERYCRAVTTVTGTGANCTAKLLVCVAPIPK
jgi:hypothetical protein